MKKKNRFIYFASVLAVSAALSALLIFLANDAFAITAKSGEESIYVAEGDGAKEISSALKKSGVIKSKTWFRTYLAVRGKSLDGVKEGSYTVSKTDGFDGIHRRLTGNVRRKRTEVTVVIPEGSTIEDILTIICDNKGICERSELIDAVQNGDFSKYDFVNSISGERLYRLEGYLYPDTYCFYSDASAYTVVDKLLSNFEAKFDEKYRKACKAKGLSVDEAVKIASIIEREAKFVSDYPKVSSVLHNRLNSMAFGGRLQSDATLTYALGRPMTAADKELESAYNSYKYKGLPPSPICSPDIEAISYALYPDKTNYYYFVSRSDGTMLYASSYEGHRYNVDKVKRENEKQN